MLVEGEAKTSQNIIQCFSVKLLTKGKLLVRKKINSRLNAHLFFKRIWKESFNTLGLYQFEKSVLESCQNSFHEKNIKFFKYFKLNQTDKNYR